MAIDEIPHPAASSTVPESAGAGDTRRMRGSNHMGMRQFNERIVLQAIRHHGAIPKADLARMTHLSSQTVAVIVGRLLEDGLLIKQDRVRGRIGQPSVPLSLNPKGAYSIGVQLGRRSLQLVVADFCGAIVERLDYRYEYPDPELVIPQIVQGLDVLRQRLGNAWPRVVGIGLTAPLFLHQWADMLGGHAAQALAQQYPRRRILQSLQALLSLCNCQSGGQSASPLASRIAVLQTGQAQRRFAGATG